MCSSGAFRVKVDGYIWNVAHAEYPLTLWHVPSGSSAKSMLSEGTATLVAGSQRRYKEIRAFHEEVKRRFPHLTSPFPGKVFFGANESSVLSERQIKFQQYFDGFLQECPGPGLQMLFDFFGVRDQAYWLNNDKRLDNNIPGTSAASRSTDAATDTDRASESFSPPAAVINALQSAIRAKTDNLSAVENQIVSDAKSSLINLSLLLTEQICDPLEQAARSRHRRFTQEMRHALVPSAVIKRPAVFEWLHSYGELPTAANERRSVARNTPYIPLERYAFGQTTSQGDYLSTRHEKLERQFGGSNRKLQKTRWGYFLKLDSTEPFEPMKPLMCELEKLLAETCSLLSCEISEQTIQKIRVAFPSSRRMSNSSQ